MEAEPQRAEEPKAPHELELEPTSEADIKYTAKDIVKLVINSYRFSQGQPALQQAYFDFLLNKFGNRFDEAVVKEAIPQIINAAENILSNPKMHLKTEDDITHEVNNDLLELLEYVSKRRPIPKADITNITNNLVERDRMFLEVEYDPDALQPIGHEDRFYKERRPRAEQSHVTHHSDPFLSQTVFYGLMGQSTNSPEFNEIFKEVAEVCKTTDNEEIREGVARLVKIHIRYHPDQRELLPVEFRHLLDR
jgi:hypothetical protein